MTAHLGLDERDRRHSEFSLKVISGLRLQQEPLGVSGAPVHWASCHCLAEKPEDPNLVFVSQTSHPSWPQVCSQEGYPG